MKKTVSISIFFLAIFCMLAAAGLTFAQNIDLSGTWIGKTYVPDAVDADEFTMVLKKENGKYSGKISDSMGMLAEAECRNIELDDNKLTFNVDVDTGEEYLLVYLVLTVDGDTMTGHWDGEDGSTGEVTMTKKKS